LAAGTIKHGKSLAQEPHLHALRGGGFCRWLRSGSLFFDDHRIAVARRRFFVPTKSRGPARGQPEAKRAQHH